MSNVVPLRQTYEAKLFKVGVGDTEIHIAGTLCGHIDVAIPGAGTMVMSPDEILVFIAALTASREDVLKNSRPLSDPMLVG